MSAIDEASLAVIAARENTKCTVIITMTFSGDLKDEYHTMMGVSPAEMVISMKEAGAHIVGSNCGNGIEEMIGIVRAIRAADDTIPIMIQPNAGTRSLLTGKLSSVNLLNLWLHLFLNLSSRCKYYRRMLRNNSGTHKKDGKNNN